ncbi:hypothetical protein GCM10027347_26950 [Larkinella harenae]
MEILVTVAIISYIIYLRYYADLRTPSEKERDQLQEGIRLFDTHQIAEALTYFDLRIQAKPQSSVARLYRARCLRAQRKIPDALEDVKTGLGYDDTVVDLHLEMGQILFEQQAYEGAFTAFDKAVFHAQGKQSEPFRWRGLTLQQLNQPQQAQQDQERAQIIAQQPATTDASPETGAFFDRRLLVNAIFILINSAVLLFSIKATNAIHWPYLLAAISAAAIGFAQPRKGWLLALLQTFALLIGYYFLTERPAAGGDRELELFCLYGSIGLTFLGSFVGGILKRTLEK